MSLRQDQINVVAHQAFPAELDINLISPETGLVMNKRQLADLCSYYNEKLKDPAEIGSHGDYHFIQELRLPNYRTSKHQLACLGVNFSIIRSTEHLYAVIKKINQGAFGRVWLISKVAVKNPKTEKYEPVTKSQHEYKVVKSIHLYRQAIPVGNVEQKLFIQEFETLRGLGLAELAYRRNHTKFQMVVNYAPGHDLERYVRSKDTNMPALMRLEIIYQIALSLEKLHAQNMLHCDIKPANIRIDVVNAKAQLIDFGFSIKLEKGISKQNMLKGTRFYIKPDLMAAKLAGASEYQYDASVDIYAFALTMMEFLGYEVLRGRNIRTLADKDKIKERDLCDKETRFVPKVFMNAGHEVGLPSIYIRDQIIRNELSVLGYELANSPERVSMQQVCRKLEVILRKARVSDLLLLKIAMLHEDDPAILSHLDQPEFVTELKKFQCVWLLRTDIDAVDPVKTERIKRKITSFGLIIPDYSYVHSELEYLIENMQRCSFNLAIPYMYTCFYLTKEKVKNKDSDAIYQSIVVGDDNVDEIITRQVERYQVTVQYAQKIIDSLQAEIDRLQQEYAQKSNGEISRRIVNMSQLIDKIKRNIEFGSLTFMMLRDELGMLANKIGHADWTPYLLQYVPGASWFVPKPKSAIILSSMLTDVAAVTVSTENDIDHKQLGRTN